MRPAVSVRGTKLSSAPDSAFESCHTTHNVDPIIFGGPNDISDSDFGSLFAADYTTGDDLQLFEDGFASSNPFDDNTTTNGKDNTLALHSDGFTFDSMVDLDAGSSESSNDITDFQASNVDTNDFLDDSLFENTDPQAPDAATSSAQQPLLGAPA